MDVSTALELLLPAAEYRGSLTDNTQAAYNALDWLDARTKPTWAQLQAAWETYDEKPQPSPHELYARRLKLKDLYLGAVLSVRARFSSVMSEVLANLGLGDFELAQFNLEQLDLSGIADAQIKTQAESLKAQMLGEFTALTQGLQ